MLHTSELHELLQAFPLACAILSPDLIILDSNQAFLALFYRERIQIIGASLLNLISIETDHRNSESREILQRSLQRVLHARTADTVALQCYAPPYSDNAATDSESRLWSIVNTPIFDNDGKLRAICHCISRTSQALPAVTSPENISQNSGFGAFPITQNELELRQALLTQRNRLHHLFDHSPGFVAFTQGPDHVFELANRAFYDIIGERDIIGKPIREALPDLKNIEFYNILDRVYKSGEAFIDRGIRTVFEARPGGQRRVLYVDLLCGPIVETDGSISGILLQGNDITQQKYIEDKLLESDLRWKFILEGSEDGLWDWDLLSDDVAVSLKLREILGYTEEERPLGWDEYVQRVHPQDRQRIAEDFEAAMKSKDGVFRSEYRVAVFNEYKWVLSRGKVVSRDKNGKPVRMSGTLTDISEKKKTEDQIWRQANFDMLTGLANRCMFREKLDHEVKLAQRSHSSLALLFIDLDKFKEVNDLMGHDIGDILLAEAALRIGNSVRGSDTVARLGGDEFTVIIPAFGEIANVQYIALKILNALANPFYLKGEAIYISGSIGITLFPADAVAPESLVKNADQAMYVAKNNGRNRYSFFTPEMQDAAEGRLRLIADLRDALAKGQFQIRFQPIIDFANWKIVKAEALLRWMHPVHGICYPTDFISLAEETGLINEIGNWVFTQSAAWAQRWGTYLGEPFQISVNTSPVQLYAEEKANWPAHLSEIGLSGSSISVEITEGALLNASPGVMKKLLDYRDAGIQVSLDDFGTGYSSMTYLKRFDIDYLKIDQSFIQDMTDDPGSRVIAEAIIMMAHKLGLKVIAEGIETEEQQDLLLSAGCDYGQGFLFAHALAPEELERLLGKTMFAGRHV